MSINTFSEALEQLSEGKNFSREEAKQALQFVIDGDVNDSQISAFLFGMRQKGETADEVTGFVEAMRGAIIPINVNTDGAVDLCGTGGDHSGSFNISTAAMFVVAGAGVPVLKHGNRSISSRSGSYDVLESLGIIPDLKPEDAKKCFEQTGLTFMFAPLYHPAMRHVMPSRRALSMRTFFNVMGPLLNPAGVKRQVVGTYSGETAKLSAEILHKLGADSAVTVHAADGMDEFSTASSSQYYDLNGAMPSQPLNFDPATVGITLTTHEALRGGDKDTNAAIIRAILEGKATKAQTEIVELNAAFAIRVSGKTNDLADALDLARESVKSGKALQKLEAMKQVSQDLRNV